MSVRVAEFIVTTIGLYMACGAAFSAVFLWRWVGILDPAATQGTVGFRLVVFPGVAMLWPVFAFRLVRGFAEPPDEWTAHRAAARRAGRDRKVEVLR
jgi:hypothetical protein